MAQNNVFNFRGGPYLSFKNLKVKKMAQHLVFKILYLITSKLRSTLTVQMHLFTWSSVC